MDHLKDQYAVITNAEELISHFEDFKTLRQMPAIVQVAHCLADSSGYRELPERMENPQGIIADHLRKHAAEYRMMASHFTEEMKKASSFYEVDAV